MNPDAIKQIPQEYVSHAEQVRETYRQQGREQEFARVESIINNSKVINSDQAFLLIKQLKGEQQ